MLHDRHSAGYNTHLQHVSGTEIRMTVHQISKDGSCMWKI